MSVHFLFTKSSKFGSKLIRWGLNHESSHVAVAFDLDCGRGVVFHSHFTGLQISWAKDFLARNTVISRLDPAIPLQAQAEERLYTDTTKNFGASYDFGAFLYFALRVILKKLFNVPIPVRSIWGSTSSFICTEVVESMRETVLEIFLVDVGLTKGIQAPDDLMDSLLKSHLLKRV